VSTNLNTIAVVEFPAALVAVQGQVAVSGSWEHLTVAPKPGFHRPRTAAMTTDKAYGLVRTSREIPL
jgi:hypothetical protein